MTERVPTTIMVVQGEDAAYISSVLYSVPHTVAAKHIWTNEKAQTYNNLSDYQKEAFHLGVPLEQAKSHDWTYGQVMALYFSQDPQIIKKHHDIPDDIVTLFEKNNPTLTVEEAKSYPWNDSSIQALVLGAAPNIAGNREWTQEELTTLSSLSENQKEVLNRGATLNQASTFHWTKNHIELLKLGMDIPSILTLNYVSEYDVQAFKQGASYEEIQQYKWDPIKIAAISNGIASIAEVNEKDFTKWDYTLINNYNYTFKEIRNYTLTYDKFLLIKSGAPLWQADSYNLTSREKQALKAGASFEEIQSDQELWNRESLSSMRYGIPYKLAISQNLTMSDIRLYRNLEDSQKEAVQSGINLETASKVKEWHPDQYNAYYAHVPSHLLENHSWTYFQVEAYKASCHDKATLINWTYPQVEAVQNRILTCEEAANFPWDFHQTNAIKYGIASKEEAKTLNLTYFEVEALHLNVPLEWIKDIKWQMLHIEALWAGATPSEVVNHVNSIEQVDCLRHQQLVGNTTISECFDISQVST
ncbi:MAG: hypothetical protein RLN62_06970 [Rickettsiales bacterium]